jgi:peroxiredoxin Q/BCP
MSVLRKMLVALGFLFCSLAAIAIGCRGTVKRPDGGRGLLPVGAPAPDLVARDVQGREVRLSSLRGKWVVVYFYPADDTPGCTKEACAFRDTWRRYEDAGVAIIGVSSNSPEKHREFQKKYGLPFPLAADEDGAIGTSYGVPKKIWGYDRVSFLVDEEGRVAKVWPSVDPGVHANEVLRAATSP